MIEERKAGTGQSADGTTEPGTGTAERSVGSILGHAGASAVVLTIAYLGAAAYQEDVRTALHMIWRSNLEFLPFVGVMRIVAIAVAVLNVGFGANGRGACYALGAVGFLWGPTIWWKLEAGLMNFMEQFPDGSQ